MNTLWQTFRGGTAKAYGDAIGVSICYRGRISFSRGALRLLGNPSHLLAHYDERNCVIGITPAEPGTPGAFAVKLRERNSGGYIQAQPFCNHFRISVDAVERFDRPQLDEHGVLCLHLKRTHRVSRRIGRPKSESGKPEQPGSLTSP